MDKATGPAQPVPAEQRRGRGKVRPRVSIEERVLPIAAPAGSRFKGYEPYLVQELVLSVQGLVLSVQAVRYRRERWLTRDGQTLTAPLPAGTEGHFGPYLRRLVLMLYHQAQSSLPRLVALLQSCGLAISKRAVQRLLSAGQARFPDEARDVLRAGLASASWLSVDDTGARHRAANGFARRSATTAAPGLARAPARAG